MIWEIYAYWNIQELAGVINAIVMITSTSDYATLMGTMVIFGVAAVTLGVVTGAGDPVQAWKYFIMAIFLYFVLFVPKTSVALIDRTGTTPAIVVQDVPLSIAVFGHLTSKVGDWMTTSYETTMQVITPWYASDGVRFEANGLLFGHKILLEAHSLSPKSIALRANFNAFFNKCVMPEIDTGAISIARMINSNDLFSEVSNVNPSLYVNLFDADGVPEAAPRNCENAYVTVNALLESETGKEVEAVAKRMYPDEVSAIARTSFESALTGNYAHMFNVSKTATEVFKQRLASNMFLNMEGLSDQDAYAKAQAEVLSRQQYSTLSQIAQNTIPKLRNVIEVILYAVFPIIILMIVVAGTKGFVVVKSYLVGLMWIQLWAPLYAVMNYMMASYRQKEFLASVQPDNALAVVNASLINAGSQSDLNIAGMLALSIPMITYALIKGGEMAMTSFVQGATAPAQQAASKAAGDVAMGNLSQGSISADNKSFMTTKGLDYNTTPSVANSAVNSTDSSGVKTTINGSGAQYRNESDVLNNAPAFEYSKAQQAASSATKEYTNSIAAARASALSASMETSSGFMNSGSLDKVANNGAAWGDDLSQKYGNNVQSTLTKMDSLANSLSSGMGIDAKTAKTLVADVGAGIGTKGLDAGLKGQLVAKYGEDLVSSAEKGLQKIVKADVSDATAFMAEFSKNENLQNRFGISEDSKTSLQGSNSKAAAFREQESSELKRSEALAEKVADTQQKLTESSSDLAKITDNRSFNPQQRAAYEGGLRDLNDAAVAARSSGNFELANNLQQQYDMQLENLASSFGRPLTHKLTEETGDNVSQDVGTVTSANNRNEENVRIADGGFKGQVEPTTDKIIFDAKDNQKQAQKGKTEQQQYMVDHEDLNNFASEKTSADVNKTSNEVLEGQKSNPTLGRLENNLEVTGQGVPYLRGASSVAAITVAGVNDIRQTAVDATKSMGWVGDQVANKLNAIADELGGDKPVTTPKPEPYQPMVFVPGENGKEWSPNPNIDTTGDVPRLPTNTKPVTKE